MTSTLIKQTRHWKVTTGDGRMPMHLVFTPVVGARADNLADMPRDERDDLYELLRDEIRDRGLGSYEVLMRCAAGQPVEVHLVVDSTTTCAGFDVADAGAEWEDLKKMLAGKGACPLCGQSTTMWRIQHGKISHEPHEPGE